MCEEKKRRRKMAITEEEIRHPQALREKMTDSQPSARDHTLTLTLELLISVSFGEHL